MDRQAAAAGTLSFRLRSNSNNLDYIVEIGRTEINPERLSTAALRCSSRQKCGARGAAHSTAEDAVRGATRQHLAQIYKCKQI